MLKKPNIAVIDDEEFYLKMWKKYLDEESDVSVFECPDDFVEKNINNFNKYDYIIVDVLFGRINILSINFSKLLRNKGYDGKLILNSNLNQSFLELERNHYYDVFILKNKKYNLEIINKELDDNKLNWRKRFI